MKLAMTFEKDNFSKFTFKNFLIKNLESEIFVNNFDDKTQIILVISFILFSKSHIVLDNKNYSNWV